MKSIKIIALLLSFIITVQISPTVTFAGDYSTDIKYETDEPTDNKTEDGVITEDGEIKEDDGTTDTKPVVTYKVEFNGHEYQVIIASGMTWEKAKAECEKRGGHLATITSQEEQDFIMTITGGTDLWIGGYRDDSYKWYWVTGEEWGYTNWQEGEPNNSSNVVKDEKYVALWPDTWNDLANKNTLEQKGYVIEWDNEDEPIVTPEPTNPPTKNPPKKNKVKKPDPPKNIIFRREKCRLTGTCGKKFKVFVTIKNDKYKTPANKKGYFKIKTKRYKKTQRVTIYCKNLKGVKSKTLKLFK